MKIAVVTEDEVTISQHFGRAPYYMVYTVEGGKVTEKERRDKAGHHTFAA
jgi:predicted Fe-Mo cluster-binding NifX family protein